MQQRLGLYDNAAVSGLPLPTLILKCTLLCSHAAVAAEAPWPDASPLDGCLSSTQLEPVALDACQSALLDTAPESLDRARVHAALAIQYVRMDDLTRARTAIDEALAIAAELADIQGNLGVVLLREGDYLAAVNAFNNMLTADPNALYNPAVYLNRALALRALGRYDEAAKDYALYLDLITLPPSPSDQTPLETPPTPAYSDSSE